jgi:Cu2+-exporting ATPase
MEALACPISQSPALCLHCGSAVPARRGGVYCCAGCEAVHGLLKSAGLTRYYSILEQVGARAAPAVGSDAVAAGGEFKFLDDPSVRALYVQADSVRFYLEGVHCAACVWLIEKLPDLVPHLGAIRLDLGTGVATVGILPGARLSEIASGFMKLGYRPHALKASEEEELERAEDRRLLLRLGVAGAAAGNIMLMAIPLYAGAEGRYAELFSWGSLALSLPVLFYSAMPFYRSTWEALRAGQLSIDVPVALGLQTSFWVSVFNLFRGNERIYFDSVTALVFLLLSSRYLLRRVSRTALKASSLAQLLMPSRARRVVADGAAVAVEDVEISALKEGDLIEVLPGDLFPADGRVELGRGTLDSRLLTGESLPEEVGPGSEVFCGTQNLASVLRFRVTGSGRFSRVGRIVQSMEASLGGRAPIVAFSDRVSRGFIAATLMLMPLVFLGALESGWDVALDRTLALALVTCPCVFALATPLTFASVLGRAARAGILIQGAPVLERLASIREAFFDKTGTLTEGRVDLLEWTVSPEQDATRVAAIVVAMESHSRHPIGRALVRELSEGSPARQLRLEVQDLREIAGRGIEARIDGLRYRIGIPADETGGAATTVVLSCEGAEIARARLGDRLRPEAHFVVSRLQEMGIRVRVLSGDQSGAVASVAERLGIRPSDAISRQTPESKKQAVEGAASSLMVGDGANDAIALASASVGIAVHGGLEASVRASDAYLSRPGIAQIPALIVLGRETLQLVKRNFAVSLVYNAIAATAAMAGWVTPLFAALLMPASSLLVLSSARLGTRKMRKALAEVSQ